MVTVEIIRKLKELPAEYSRIIENYLDFLSSQVSKAKKKSSGIRKQRIPGLAKGKLWIAPDFDAPLDDMKEYME
jgi:hypothetical protein